MNPAQSTPHRCTRRRWLASGAAALLPLGAAAQPVPIGHRFDWPPLALLDAPPLAPSAWHDTGAILVFWATHCPFCLRHNAHVDRLHRTLGGRPVRVLGAALDRDAPVVRRYLAAHDYRFPVTLDAEPLRARLGLRRVIPTTCVFDRQGRLRECIPGEMFEEDVLGLVALALAQAG